MIISSNLIEDKWLNTEHSLPIQCLSELYFLSSFSSAVITFILNLKNPLTLYKSTQEG